MLRQSLLFLSDNPTARRLVTETNFSRRLAERFVAGDTLDDAIRVARSLNDAGLSVSLDYLGESVAREEEANSAAEMCLLSLERIASDRIDGNISVKPTQLGLDIDEELCLRNIERILSRARELGDGEDEIFVRLDMEASKYTEATIHLVETLWDRGFRNVGTVLQAYLRRTPDDVERMNRLGSRVRLVKGAYREPPEAAYVEKEEVDRMFVEEMKRLLDHGHYPAIATHDEALIAATRHYAFERGIPRESFEFQMLYGIRRDLQQRLREEGYHLRVYLPYGEFWYPYLMRRVAERPGNLWFVAGSVAKESTVGEMGLPAAVGAGFVFGGLATMAWRSRNGR